MGDCVKGFWLNTGRTILTTAAGGCRFLRIVFLQVRSLVHFRTYRS